MLDQLAIPEICAVGEHGQHDGFAVLARADLVDLAVGDENQLVGRIAPADDLTPGVDVALLELVRYFTEYFGILREAPQHRQLS